MEKTSSAYNPQDIEDKIYKSWMESGYFTPEKLPDLEKRTAKGTYTIAIAPPNITGSLHMGHALENTIADILIRYHRMAGYRTLWIPGTDHAGIATQNVVEKNLKKEGLSRHDLGKEKFIEKIWEWKEQYGSYILKQLEQLGFSLDWSRTRFTMDEGYQEAVKTAFEHYNKQGLVYQGERVINWCIKDQTALSDLELEYVEEKSKLWFLRYPVIDSDLYLVVATTRPETMLGDTAVAVNPKDLRYAKLIGETIRLPIINREIPIIADTAVEMEFGTGAVKVTPAHDFADSDMAGRHNLPFLKVINEVGKMVNVPLEFEGLKMSDAREKVVQKFKELGLLEKEQELVHNVAKCYRCASTVEPMLSKQWFLKMKPLAEKALESIRSRQVRFFPQRWEKVSIDWLENIRDWCISRQIWWGHRIPIEGSEDVFDTWFSSALWPFATLGWPEQTEDLAQYYPNSVITSGRDILNLWILRMIFSGLELQPRKLDGKTQAPFAKAIIHATILTKDGKRMSKSLGTGIDPMGLIEKYGADATRFGLIYQALGGQDIHFNEDVLVMGKKFCNKLWNIARYVALKNEAAEAGQGSDMPISAGLSTPQTQDPPILPAATEPANIEILKQLAALHSLVTKQILDYEFGQAAHELYDFIWKEFADKYIELSKKSDSEETKQTLRFALATILKLLHPFMPFITEELWGNIAQGNMLIVTPWEY